MSPGCQLPNAAGGRADLVAVSATEHLQQVILLRVQHKVGPWCFFINLLTLSNEVFWVLVTRSPHACVISHISILKNGGKTQLSPVYPLGTKSALVTLCFLPMNLGFPSARIGAAAHHSTRCQGKAPFSVSRTQGCAKRHVFPPAGFSAPFSLSSLGAGQLPETCFL